MMNKTISLFRNISTPKNPAYASVNQIVKRIRNGKDEKLVNQVVSSENPGEAKKQLPVICWSGIFSSRSNDGLDTHSGLICLDFDHVDNLQEFRKEIEEDKFTHVSFISPSGTGLKVVVKIPPSAETHKRSALALQDYFDSEYFDLQHDVARACFSSFDPEIYYNPDSRMFETLAEEPVEDVKRKVSGFSNKKVSPGMIAQSDDVVRMCEAWVERRESFQEGNRNRYVMQLAAAMNRFGVPQSTAESYICSNYSSESFPDSEIKTTVNSAYRYTHQHGSAVLIKDDGPYHKTSGEKFTEEDFDGISDEQDIVLLDHVRDKMMHGFYHGTSLGITTHFKSMDAHFRWVPGQVTFLGGIGNHGKSTMLKQLLLLQAVYEDACVAWFGPEEFPAQDFYNDLIHMYVGKSTEPYHKNQMSLQEYEEAMDFLKSRFYYVYPENNSPTPEYINNRMQVLIEKHGVNFCVTDPFNQLDNDWGRYGRDDQYIGRYLSSEKRFAQDHDIHKIIVGHPKGSGIGKSDGMNYDVPQVLDYAGGAMWNNKCDNIICYHRPNAISDPQDPECFFLSQKIKKRKITGVPGRVILEFDVMSNRFLENGKNPMQPDFEDVDDRIPF